MRDRSASSAPLPRRWTKGWKIGTPDTVLQIPRAFKIPAEGTVPYKYTSITTDFPEDRWVEAFELRPTAPQAVAVKADAYEKSGQRDKARARIAVARKLACLLHHLWRTGSVWDPNYATSLSSRNS